MKYVPEVNDYVVWKNREHVEGWVYFKEKQYITIEVQVRPKHPDDLPNGTHHRNERVLVLCYPNQWDQLQYIKSRKSVNDE
jgi:hypothetical protein